jgi:glycosyltransferase involved in cell wall biosynthesis
MKIGILGTRGIPNNHGGFEQFAEYLASGLVAHGFKVSVYNSHSHPFQNKEWCGAEIIHCFDPEEQLGTIGQFIYDFNCIVDSRKRNFDIILQLGYTSNSVWGRLLPRKNTIITTNMDGLEWKRSKYSKLVRRFLRYAEKLGVKFSDHHISDSIGIQDYLLKHYLVASEYIPYGANLFSEPNEAVLCKYGVSKYAYNMLIARLEPENSIEVILDGVAAATIQTPFLVIGKHQTKYGDYLKLRYKNSKHIRFQGGIYNLDHLNNLRYFSSFYFHGHTVGGTNPSLLEAMASNALICAHNNPFNKYILEDDALYFEYPDEVLRILNKNYVCKQTSGLNNSMIERNRDKISNIYAWPIIVQQYIDHFNAILSKSNNKKVAKHLVVNDDSLF